MVEPDKLWLSSRHTDRKERPKIREWIKGQVSDGTVSLVEIANGFTKDGVINFDVAIRTQARKMYFEENPEI